MDDNDFGRDTAGLARPTRLALTQAGDLLSNTILLCDALLCRAIVLSGKSGFKAL